MTREESDKVHELLSLADKDVYRECDRKDWGIHKLPREHLVFWAVEQAQGKIDNGGFQYFFENDWPQKPFYAVFIRSFNMVGALRGARCLERAVALFPFPEPHLDYKRRREFMDQLTAREGEYRSAFDKLSHEMMDLSDENFGKLAAYVRLNVEAFPTVKALLKQK